MRAKVKRYRTDEDGHAGDYWVFTLYDDSGNTLRESIPHYTESDAREACRKYFPQFKLDEKDGPVEGEDYAITYH